MQAEFTLPYPPSINHYYSVYRGRKILSAEGRAYKETVAKYLLINKQQKLSGRIGMCVHVFVPDLRRRDLDNLWKPLLDSLSAGRLYDDDSQIDDERMVRAGVAKGGYVKVTAWSIATIACPDCKTSATRLYMHNYVKGGSRYECMNTACERKTFIVK